MDDVTDCDRCEMDRECCEHGLTERRRTASATAASLLISPSNKAHSPCWHHKGDDPDYNRWAEFDMQYAWERLGNGEELRATDGRDLIAKSGARTVAITAMVTKLASTNPCLQTVDNRLPSRSAAWPDVHFRSSGVLGSVIPGADGSRS